jgi:GT2 family glycosyltransferase
MIKTHRLDIKFIQNKENLGFQKWNNIAVFQAQVYLYSQPDTVVAEDTFEIVMAFAKKQEESWNYWRKAY